MYTQLTLDGIAAPRHTRRSFMAAQQAPISIETAAPASSTPTQAPASSTPTYSTLAAATHAEKRAIKNANRRNAAKARKYPLLAYAGLLDYETPEQRAAQLDRISSDFRMQQEQRAARNALYIAACTEYLDDLDISAADLIAQSYLARNPQLGAEYHADFLCMKLAERTGSTKLQVHDLITSYLDKLDNNDLTSSLFTAKETQR